MAKRRRSKRLETRVVMSCSNEVSVYVVVVEFSTRTLNTVLLRDHFLFYFVLLIVATTMYTKILFFLFPCFFPQKSLLFSKVWSIGLRSRPMKKEFN